MAALFRWPTKIADAFALAQDQTYKPGRTKQDHEQQQHAQDDRPDILIVVREPEADGLDHDGADDGADQCPRTAKENIEYDLGRHHDAKHVGPDEAFVKGVQASGKPGDGAAKRKDNGLEVLNLIAKEGDALLVFPQSGERQTKLRARQEAAQQIDGYQECQRKIIKHRSFGEFVAPQRHGRDRRDPVLSTQIVPSPRQTIDSIRAGQRAQGDKNDARGMTSQQQKATEQKRKGKSDQDAGRQDEKDRSDAEIPCDQGNAISRRAEEYRLTEAHNSRVPPNEVEREREQAQDQHASGIDRQIVLQHERQKRGNRQNDQFHDRQLLPSKGGPHGRGTAKAAMGVDSVIKPPHPETTGQGTRVSAAW